MKLQKTSSEKSSLIVDDDELADAVVELNPGVTIEDLRQAVSGLVVEKLDLLKEPYYSVRMQGLGLKRLSRIANVSMKHRKQYHVGKID